MKPDYGKIAFMAVALIISISVLALIFKARYEQLYPKKESNYANTYNEYPE